MQPRLLAPVLAALALGQLDSVSAQVDPPRMVRDSIHISRTAVGATAAGRSYEATFDEDGVTFVPVLGLGAPTIQTLRIDACSVGRESSASQPLQPAFPRVEDRRVVYERAGGVTEIHEVSPEGIEQSFLIERSPAGTGDLVVRCALGGSLAGMGRTSASGGLSFAGTWGGVGIGRVIGVDARGVRCEGTLRAGSDCLELVLPARFVDAATWPVLVDPLIGTVFSVNNEGFDDDEPDVAFDSSLDLYLVVWRRTFSATNSVIRGQRVDELGNLVGPRINFGSSQFVNGPPRVASMQYGNRFLVVWEEDFGVNEVIYGQACAAVDGSLSSVVSIASLASPYNGYDVAGEARLDATMTQALVVYHQAGIEPGIYCRPVTVPYSGDPVNNAAVRLTTDVSGLLVSSAPAISKTGGAMGNFLVAYRTYSLFLGDTEIAAVAVDRAGNPITSSVVLTSNAVDEGEPRVDGGASLSPEFIVAYERDPNPTLREFEIKTLKIAQGALVDTGTTLVGQSLFPMSDFDVAWTPGRATLVWVRRAFLSSDYIIYTRDVDMVDGDLCGALETVGTVTPTNGGVHTGIASVQSGGKPGHGDGLIAMSYETSSGNGDVFGRRFDSLPAGSLTDLGGGCGSGGWIIPWGDPALGNGFFQMVLVGADPAAFTTILNITTPVTPFSCGSCLWLPFQATTAYPVLGGASQVIIGIPCDPGLAGATFEAQFTTLTPSSSPCPLLQHVSVSNRLQIVLGT